MSFIYNRKDILARKAKVPVETSEVAVSKLFTNQKTNELTFPSKPLNSRVHAKSIAMNVPVLPTPALHNTVTGPG